MKKTSFQLILIGLLLFIPSAGFAKLKVVTTIPDFAALVREIGGDTVTVNSISIGTQDPHFVEAKPSFMLLANKADLFIVAGLDLEEGWAQAIIQGSRNPKIIVGTPGYLELGQLIEPLEVPTVRVTRAQGDVHPFGNPHFYLDPIRMGQSAVLIAERMAQLDSTQGDRYIERGKQIQQRLETKTKDWQIRIEKTGVKKVISFHRTLSYFFNRFGITYPTTLEPKPGIPPTTKHIMDVIQIVKTQKVPLIMIENFFETTSAKRIQQDVSSVRVVSVPVAVGGEPNILTTDDLIERLVAAVEGK